MEPGTGTATITAAGVLTPTTAGTVTVKASVNSEVVQTIEVTIVGAD